VCVLQFWAKRDMPCSGDSVMMRRNHSGSRDAIAPARRSSTSPMEFSNSMTVSRSRSGNTATLRARHR
jgi:hypothetical protein